MWPSFTGLYCDNSNWSPVFKVRLASDSSSLRILTFTCLTNLAYNSIFLPEANEISSTFFFYLLSKYQQSKVNPSLTASSNLIILSS